MAPAPAPALIERPLAGAPIQVFRGDHLHVLPALPPESVDFICTSPNYNIGWQYGDDVDGDRLPLSVYKTNLSELLLGCQQVLRVGGVLAIVVPPAINIAGADGQRLFFTADFVRACLQEQGWLLRESIIVGKSARDDEPMPFARGGIKGNVDDPRFRFSHEVIVLASKGTYSIGGRESWDDKPQLREALKDQWWLHPTKRAGACGPAPFRAELVRRLLWICTSAGDLVLDPNAGTGMTGRVASQMGRRAWLIERQPSYWDRLDRLVRGSVRASQAGG